MTDTAIDHSTTRFRGQLIPLSGSKAPQNREVNRLSAARRR